MSFDLSTSTDVDPKSKTKVAFDLSTSTTTPPFLPPVADVKGLYQGPWGVIKGIGRSAADIFKPQPGSPLLSPMGQYNMLGGEAKLAGQVLATPFSIPLSMAASTFPRAAQGVSNAILNTPLPTPSSYGVKATVPGDYQAPTLADIKNEISQKLPEKAKQFIKSTTNIASVFPIAGGSKLVGAGLEDVAKQSLIKSADKVATGASEQLFKNAPQKVRDILPGATSLKKQDAIKNSLQKYDLAKYFDPKNPDPLKGEQEAYDLAKSAIDKADETLLTTPTSTMIKKVVGDKTIETHYNPKSPLFNPIEIVDKTILDEISKGTKGMFSGTRAQQNTMINMATGLRNDWATEWSGIKTPEEILDFKRNVLNRKKDIFKKIDEMDPTEKPETLIKKEIYLKLNEELAKISKPFDDYNQDAKALMLIRDAAAKYKSPAIKPTTPAAAVVGTTLGAGTGGIVGGMMGHPGIGAAVGGTVGANVGALAGQYGTKVITAPLAATRAPAVGLGRLLQYKSPITPITESQQYIKNLTSKMPETEILKNKFLSKVTKRQKESGAQASTVIIKSRKKGGQ